MWNKLIKLITDLLRVLAPLFIAKKWGEASAAKEQADQSVEELKEDAKIASKSGVDNPFGRMRNDKDSVP
jgi:hypothetical protein